MTLCREAFFPSGFFLFSQVLDQVLPLTTFDWITNGLYVEIAQRFPRVEEARAYLCAFARIGLRSGVRELSGVALALLGGSVRAIRDTLEDLRPYLLNFDQAGFALLSRLSVSDHSEAVCRCYSTIANAFFSSILRGCDFTAFRTDSHSLHCEHIQVFAPCTEKFFRSERLYFPSGFTALPDEYFGEFLRPEALLDERALRLVTSVADLISSSDRACIGAFMDEFHVRHQKCADPEVALGMMAVLQALLRLVQVNVIWTSGIARCPNSCLDCEDHIVFYKGTLHPVMAALRVGIIDLFISKDPALLNDYLMMSADKPMLFVERLGWVLARLPRSRIMLFQCQNLIEKIFEISKMVRELPWSDEIAIARNICFLFLFELAKLPLFDWPHFVRGFFVYIFEPEVSERILCVIQSVCAKSVALNCRAAVGYFRKALAECNNAGNAAEADLAAGISETAVRIMQLNMQVHSQFERLFSNIMGCFRVFHSRRLLLAVLNFMSLATIKELKAADIRSISRLVKSEFRDDRTVYRRILLLLSLSDRHSMGGVFLIERPALLPLILACYGSSAVIEDILALIKTLTDASAYNLRQCHSGDLDLIFIDFLSTGLESAAIQYCGFPIDLTISVELQERAVVPLFTAMASYISSYSIAAKFVELLMYGNPVVTRIFANVLEATAKLPSQISPCCLGSMGYSLSGLEGRDLSKTFSISLSFRLDLLLVRRDNASVDLLKITNTTGTRSLAISSCMRDRWGLVLTCVHERGRTTAWLSHSINRNAWNASVFVFVFPSSGGQNLTVETYENSELDSKPPTVRIPMIDFGDSALVAEIGRTTARDGHANAIYGDIANIRFFDHALSRSEIASLVTLGGVRDSVSLKYDAGEQIARSVQWQLLNCNLIDKILRAEQVPFDRMLLLLDAIFSGAHFTNAVVDRLQQILVEAPTLSAYFALFSRMRQAENRLYWFKSLIFDFWLWSRLDGGHFEAVLCHWATDLICECRDLLKHPSFFARSLAIFHRRFHSFGMPGTPSHRMFIRLLKRLASIGLSESNANSLFIVCAQSPDAETAGSYLDIIADVSCQITKEIATKHYRSLLGFVHKFQSEAIFRSVLLVFCLLPSLDPMIILPLVRLCDDWQIVFSRMLTELEFRPALYESMAMLAVLTGGSAGPSFARLCDRVPDMPDFRERSLWYIWPLVLVVASDDSDALIRFLASASCRSADDIVHISHLISYLETRLEHSHPASLVRLYLAEVAQKVVHPEVRECIFEMALCHHIFHDRSSCSTHRLEFLSQFTDSPFMSSVSLASISPGAPKTKIQDIEALLSLLKKPEPVDHVFSLPKGPLPGFFGFLDSPIAELSGVLDMLLRAKKNPPVDVTDQVQALQERFQSTHQTVIGTLGKEFSRRAKIGEVFYLRETTSTRIDDPGLPLDSLDRISPRQEQVVPEKYRSSRVCNGCPVLILNRIPRKPRPMYNAAVPLLPTKSVVRASIDGSHFVLESRTKARMIPLSEIELFVRHDAEYGELFTVDKKSYMLCAPKTIPGIEELPALQLRWTNNFDFLIALNRLSGRSFGNPARYPIFPVITKITGELRVELPQRFTEPTRIEKLRDIVKDLSGVAFVGPEVYCLPEVITGKLPPWAHTQSEFVYEMRKRLEDGITTDSLQEWIGRVWVSSTALKGISHRAFLTGCPDRIQPASKARCLIQRQLGLSDIRFAWLADEDLGIVAGCGRVLLYSMLESDVPSRCNDGLSSDLSGYDFFAANAQLMIYNKMQKTLTGAGQEMKMEISSRLFALFGRTWLFCPNCFELWRSDRRLCYSESRIVALAATWVFQVFVFATADCKLHFHCARKGTQIACPIDTPDMVDGILITEKWGFVLTHSTCAISLYSINATKIKQVEIPHSVVAWSAFSSYSGFDYIACALGNGAVFVFEAFYPERMNQEGEIHDAILVQFDAVSDRLVMVNSDGEYIASPYRFPSSSPRVSV
jgi:hypothetical protein